MSSLNIRHIHSETLKSLKYLANLHHRSLQGELHAILTNAAQLADKAKVKKINLFTVKTGHKKNWSRTEIYNDQGR